MDVSDLLDSLNEKQREAVAAPRSNLLVLAGAGSGKTRYWCIASRLLSVENCSPYSIMAVTFTNKAAAEMRHRIEHLIGTSGAACGSALSTARRIVCCAHHTEANLPQDFQILDSDDQLRLLKRIIKALNVDEKQWPPRQAMWYINGKKDEGLRLARRDLQQSGRGHGCASIRPIRKPAIARGWWISPSCCCARTSCG